MKILTPIRSLALAWACVLSVPAQAELAPLKTVAAVDVPRYMGTWHEVAKYPNWFQKKCASSTQATYTLQTDGAVQVLNRCKTAKGEWTEALGAARQIGGPTSPQLKVRFAPAWLSFIPMVWGGLLDHRSGRRLPMGGGERTQARVFVDLVTHAANARSHLPSLAGQAGPTGL